MKLADNPAKILFPQDGQWSPFYESQHQAIRRGTFPVATLLLADDSLTTQKVVNLTFADEGIEVITADDGDTALQLFHERQPDIVLADVNMPGLNGYEVCEAIRKTNDSQKTPVVLLVGSFEPFDAQEAHRVGANDYLTKPFSSIRRLVATVLAFLDERPAPAESELSIDGVEEITVEPATPEPEMTSYEQASFEKAAEAQESSVAEADVAESGAPESNGAAPEPAPEPDMYSTTDIEQLYTQSFAETVEMPHTVAERMRFNDGSADDELIETTYTEPTEAAEPQPQVLEIAEQTPQIAQQSETLTFDEPANQDSVPQISHDTAEAAQINADAPTAIEHFESSPLDVSSAVEEPAVADSYNAPEAIQEVRPQDAPTEEYNFEYRSEETYFEPAAESAGEAADSSPANTEQPQPSGQVDQMHESYSEAAVETEPPPTELQTPAPTPWDSVAPASREFSFDESNLLELPADSNTYSENNFDRETSASHPESALSAETVERIARIVASQMSEELIREIAERVVPLVVEETMARRAREEVNT